MSDAAFQSATEISSLESATRWTQRHLMTTQSDFELGWNLVPKLLVLSLWERPQTPVLTILGGPAPDAALHLLEIAELELKQVVPTLLWDNVAMVRAWIREANVVGR